jgi:hypothetical protein
MEYLIVLLFLMSMGAMLRGACRVKVGQPVPIKAFAPAITMLGIFFCTAFVTGCTENDMAKNWGGTMNVELKAGTKLDSVTWKEDELWYLTRPMREGEQPETWIFQEKSSLGIQEGKVIFKEKAQ